MVNRLVIRPTFDNSSRLIYILDNFEYSPNMSKIKQLGYYYRKENDWVDQTDVESIIQIICLFIKKHLNENIQYTYHLDSRYQTQSLIIFTDAKKSIEIKGETLIDKIEKFGIIDNLAAIRDYPNLLEQSALLLKKQ